MPEELRGKAPYNPYDPTEARPLGGYPSEFAIPGTKSNSGIIAPASEFQRVKNAMNRLGYHPRPRSSVYPGQYKLLRRIDDQRARFWRGAKYVTAGIVGIGSIYIVFFHRWNDGYDSMFSKTYRFQLHMKWLIKGTLTKQEFEDLHPKQRGYAGAVGHGGTQFNKSNEGEHETNFALQRPTNDQQVAAEKQMQEREENYWKAIDMAEKILKEKEPGQEKVQSLDTSSSESDKGKKKWWW
ncbi:hypothetical protein DASC09_040910 [Saccharomycopsis crataegensis]|uniref:Uncharacterized protein n=1 Tax=Saccharomycopsis crataegensis TaxID=43959 RepID=A0AAV5QQC5_9ASCO|nr:hypothetical protein DASC09_040910 [Saccharomycopsis crataegensis]